MADYTISVDAGNGMTNAVQAQSRGRYKSVAFPSVRAAATGDSLGLNGGGIGELDYEYVDWGAHRYVIGDDVVRVSRRAVERHQGAQRYGDEFHQFLVAVALGKLGVKKGAVDLTLFAPPGMFVQARELMTQRFKEGAIKFKGDKKPRAWRYESVTVYPEGIGAAACFALDETGNVADSDVLTGQTVILDMGVYTLDALLLTDGNFNPESLQTATWEQGGLRAHIHNPILAILKKQSNDFAFTTVDDIDMVLRKGLETGDYTITAGAVTVDLKPLFDKFGVRFSEWIANNIIDGVFGGLRGIKSCILVGGGTPLTETSLANWYNDKLLNGSETVKGISPVDMNAVGGLRLALLRQQQGA